jgi:Domain of unknown function (DUF4342)
MEDYIMNAPVDGVENKVEPGLVEIAPIVSETKTDEKISVEEFSISGDSLVPTIKELIHQGNIRRITIKNQEGGTLIEIPLTVGLVGGVISAALFPVIASVGVIGAMVAQLKIAIERKE